MKNVLCVCVHVQVEARGHSSESVQLGSGDRVSLLLPCKSKVSSWLCHPLTPPTLCGLWLLVHTTVQCFLRWVLVISDRIQVRVFVHQHFMTELCRPPHHHHTSDLRVPSGAFWQMLRFYNPGLCHGTWSVNATPRPTRPLLVNSWPNTKEQLSSILTPFVTHQFLLPSELAQWDPKPVYY